MFKKISPEKFEYKINGLRLNESRSKDKGANYYDPVSYLMRLSYQLNSIEMWHLFEEDLHAADPSSMAVMITHAQLLRRVPWLQRLLEAYAT